MRSAMKPMARQPIITVMTLQVRTAVPVQRSLRRNRILSPNLHLVSKGNT
ncbi:hypothetical protein [Caudoviricetes sp.]|nr:hypothetical protein [Caudoviricetes sp.]